MRITYKDGTSEEFDKVDETEIGEEFISLNNEDGDTEFDVKLEEIRKIEYD